MTEGNRSSTGENATRSAPDILELIEGWCRRTPDATALVEETSDLTYAQLLDAVASSAERLAARGVQPGDLVAIALPRGLRAVVTMLAVLRLGAGYVPIDIESPSARVHAMLDAARPRIGVVDGARRDLLDGVAPVLDLDDTVSSGAGDRRSRPGTPDRRVRAVRDLSGTAAVPAPRGATAYVIFTSGSTGVPKGVAVPRGALSFFCDAAREAYGIRSGDRVLQFAALGFDASVEEIMLSLSVGATVVFRDDEMLSRPDLFLRRCDEWGLTVIAPPPAYWLELLELLERDASAIPSSVRLVVLGGEAVHADALDRWRRAVGTRVRLINCYGPTETTVVALVAELTDFEGPDPVPIGRPLPGVLTRVRSDADLAARGDDETGELWIGGPGVSNGYLGLPELTAERFPVEPDVVGAVRWYRTGDVVTRLPDGQLAYLRRRDHQVQVRGVRVEVGEIEAAAREVPGVREAAVVAVPVGGTTRLEAHLLCAPGEAPDEATVRSAVARRVPPSMVPGRVRFHDVFPRTLRGKVDRDALVAASGTVAVPDAVGASAASVADPAGRMAELWSHVLQRSDIGVDDDLFAVGVDSLSAVRILARVRATHGAELTLEDLYAAPTPARLASLVSSSTPGAVGPTDAPTRGAVGEFELTGLQRDFWLTEMLDPTLPKNVLGLRYRLDRDLDDDELTRALEVLVRRHPALGARFPERDGWPTMVVDGEGGIPLSSEAHPEPVDLADGPLVRAVHDRAARTLTVFAHHLVFDGWSSGVLARDLGRILATEGSPDQLWAEREIAVPAFAEPRDESERQADRDHWRSRLATAGPCVGIAPDLPDPAEPTFAAFRVQQELAERTVSDWERLGRESRASLFVVVLAGLQALVSRETGRTDPVVLAPVANRAHAGLEDEIGAFLNTLPLRADTAGDPSFADLLGAVARTTVADLDHQHLPLADIIRTSGRDARAGSGNPFSSILVTIVDTPWAHGGPVRYAGSVAPAAQTVDLAVELDVTDSGATLSFIGRSELYEHGRVAGLLDDLIDLLDAAAAAPATRLSRLLASERGPRREAAGPDRPPRFPLAHAYLEAVAHATPAAPAVTADGVTVRYDELDARANRLAHHLRDRSGTAATGPVAIALPRGSDLFVAFWAVLKAGRAFVALDLDHPLARRRHMLVDSGATVVISRQGLADDLGGASADGRPPAEAVLLDRDSVAISGRPDTAPPGETSPSDPAYLVYTSGSTGTPKAVVVDHGNLTHAIEMWLDAYALRPEWTYLQNTGVSFDVFIGETVRAHAAGGRLVVVPREVTLDPPALLDVIRRERLVCTEMVPSIIRPLLALGEALDGVELLIGGGEAWPAAEYELARSLVPAGRVVNSYGATEATVDSLWFEGPLPDGATSVPIGRPYPNQRAYVLDESGEPVGSGVAGELHLGGAGVAVGYHRLPELTRERFRDDPFLAGGRMYRTGDAARVREDGVVEFLGRLDDQVKVNGNRIELGEVQAALRRLPEVYDSAAAVRDGALVGYVVGRAGMRPPTESTLLASVAEHLPAGSVPVRVLVLPELPRTSAGKLDRGALPAPGTDSAPIVVEHPASPTERRVARIWAQQLSLDVDEIDVGSTFTQLGGDSFATVRMARALSERLRLVDVFRRPTLRELAALLDTIVAPVPDGPLFDADSLLQPLGRDRARLEEGGLTVVGVTYAGGTAAAFVPLSDALPETWSLLAVELPGHDPARDEPLLTNGEIADRVVGELARVSGPVLVLGQCVGAALALQIAMRAGRQGIDLAGVALGAQFPVARLSGGLFDRIHRLLPTDSLIGDRAYLDFLRARGGFADVEEGRQSRFVLRNVRHDTRQAEEFFTAEPGDPADPPLAVPLLSIVGERDVTTELYGERCHEWEAYSPRVELAVIEHGGHFFVKHQADQVADLLVDAAARWRGGGGDGTGGGGGRGGGGGVDDGGPRGGAPAPDRRGAAAVSAPAGTPSAGSSAAARARADVRRFGLVALGQTISTVGSGIASLVIAIWALDATSDLTLFGLLSAAGLLPGILVLPWSGAVADRFDRRRVLIVSNAVSTAAMGALALLVSTGRGMQIPVAFAVLAVTSIASAFQRPAFLAAVPQLVPKRLLGQAAGVSQVAVAVGQIAGPLLGAGLLVALGITGVLLLEAAGFAVAMLTLLAVRFPDRAVKAREESMARELSRGWSYLMRRRPLRAALGYIVVDVAIYTVGYTVVTPLILARHSPVVLGVVLASGGIGGVLGAIAMSLWGGTRRRTDGMIIAGGIGGLGLVVVGASVDPALAAAGMFVLLFTEAIIDGSWIAVLGAKVDPQLLGRVMAIFTTLPLITIPLGFLVVLPVADSVVVPALRDPATSPWLPTAVFGAGGDRGLALLAVASGILLVAWAVRGWFLRPLRQAESLLPDAVPDAVILDRDTIQERADEKLVPSRSETLETELTP